MISPDWSKVLVEAPLVGAFVIYSIYMYRAFMDALAKDRESFDKRNQAVIEAIAELNRSVCGKLDRLKPARASTTSRKN